MEKLNLTEMSTVNGGSKLTAGIAGAACVGAAFWPIGTLIFGPTCGGMILATLID